MSNDGIKLEAHDLNLWYGENHALKGINISLPDKMITALIGPSGCGKSTFLRSLNRMNDLVEGCRIEGVITLGGTDIYKDMDVNILRKRVGMVFQKPNPFPMSIYDNIAYGPRIHGIKSRVRLDEIVEDSLKKAALWEECKDRRIIIYQDETHIPRVVSRILEDWEFHSQGRLFNAILTTGMISRAIAFWKIMVTHNMQQAARISDKTAFFLMGEIVEFNETDRVFSSPDDKRTEDYISGRFG